MGLYSFLRKIKNKFVTEIAATNKQAVSVMLTDELETVKMLSTRYILLNQANGNKVLNLQDAEFKVFSLWSDDGIIQYLINKIEISSERFIEFVVENYLESNTRFLLYLSAQRSLSLIKGLQVYNVLTNQMELI